MTTAQCVSILQAPRGHETLVRFSVRRPGSGERDRCLLTPVFPTLCAHNPLGCTGAPPPSPEAPHLSLSPRHLRTRPPALSLLRARPHPSPHCSAPVPGHKHKPLHLYPHRRPVCLTAPHTGAHTLRAQGLRPCRGSEGMPYQEQSERTFGHPAPDSGSLGDSIPRRRG